MPSTAVIYLCRHAEKSATGPDPALSVAGKARAERLAVLLGRAGIRHIYSTPYRRTRETAEPLAQHLLIPVHLYEPQNAAAFAHTLLAQDGATLVIGHTDTIPELMQLLGAAPGAFIAESEFDRLYQVVIGADGTVMTTLLTTASE